MRPELGLADLERAAANLGRLHQFLAARGQWTPTPEARPALERLGQALRGTAEGLGPILAAADVDPAEAAFPAVEAAAPGTLEPARLARFSAFLDQLTAWLESRSRCTLPAGGRAPVSRMAAALDGAYQTVIGMLGERPAVPPHPPPTPPPSPPPVPAPGPGPAGLPAEAELPDGPAEELVLDPAGDLPMLETRSGFTVLTAEAEDLLDRFVAATGLVMTLGQRRAFGITVRQRLQGAPDGHGLLVRVGALRGRLEPYYAYTLFEAPEDSEEG